MADETQAEVPIEALTIDELRQLNRYEMGPAERKRVEDAIVEATTREVVAQYENVSAPVSVTNERAIYEKLAPAKVRRLGITSTADPDWAELEKEHSRIVMPLIARGTFTADAGLEAIDEAARIIQARKANRPSLANPLEVPAEDFKARVEEGHQRKVAIARVREQHTASQETGRQDQLAEIRESFGGTLASASAQEFRDYQRAADDPAYRVKLVREIRKKNK